MARRTGPKHKLCRTVGVPLCGSPKCPVLKRPYPPGEHGPKRRVKRSEYGIQLLEKQKLRYIYGVQEKQFRRYYNEAARRTGITGENLLQLLETRLDNIVFRLGFAPTLDASRQLVTHRHVTVNQQRVDIPSYRVKPGDVIGMTERGLQIPIVHDSLENRFTPPAYLSFDESTNTGTLVRQPMRDEIPVPVNETLVIELYSR